MPELQGRDIGGYTVVSLLGRGGMAEGYRARDVRLGRDVAIKILPVEIAGSPERIARFEREPRLLAALSHSHPTAASFTTGPPGKARWSLRRSALPPDLLRHGDRRFLLMKDSAEGAARAAREMVVVQNWQEEVKRLVRAN